ncbi:MAG: glycosyltransferase [Flavobacterium sp.]|uniref:glycosyltransferase n=1 Tax=Flavobacterium sp. TaxID=239 RepID=UPI0022BE1A11|nr:glycosyltransferase [Flavobacterium sp.]MCZ8197284.1 glycosyltransferase [Flavobacterium sp.]
MKLLVISAAPLIISDSKWKAYDPYIKEMSIWAKYSDSIQFCCPIWKDEKKLLVSQVPFNFEKPIELFEFNIKSFQNAIHSIWYSLKNIVIIYKAMKSADHIHLRCPGNIGLLGCFVQILFPHKKKTAKYAGNWISQDKQPFSYKLQKTILENTFLTKNMNVLVYGTPKNYSKNIKPFFTATYFESDKIEFMSKSFSDGIKFLFVGTLSAGKRPFYAIQIVEKILCLGYKATLELYGEGMERDKLTSYLKSNNLEKNIFLKGNQTAEIIKKEYQKAHFMILPSKSEGWPKAVAEAMFMGCLPIATKISCVPNMLNDGERGLLLEMNIDKDVDSIEKLINNDTNYNAKVRKALEWSQNYTIDRFEEEIKLLLQP